MLEQNNQTTKQPTNFETLLTNFETLHINAPHSIEYSDTLQELSTAIAYSVLRKVIDPQKFNTQSDNVSNSGFNSQLVNMKNVLYRDIQSIKNVNVLEPLCISHTLNDSGDDVTIITDRALYDGYNKLISHVLSDGMDLVQVASLAILEQCGSELVNDSELGFIEKPYYITRLKKKIVIKKEDSKNGYETIATTPIQEVYRKVRKYIQDNKSLQIDPKNMYTYIDLDDSNDSDSENRIYKRLDKYADLGGVSISSGFNTVENTVINHIDSTHGGLYTADSATVDTMERLIDKLELTSRQAQVLKLRLRGYGLKAIGTYLGVSHQAIAKTLKQVQTKTIDKLGLTQKQIDKLTK